MSGVTRALSVSAAARERPRALALICGRHRLSYAQLARLVRARIERMWRVEPERIGQRLPLPCVARVDLKSVLTVLAALELGVPLVLVHPRLTAGERRALLEGVALDRPLDAQAPQALLFSSGTTGKPKGILLSRDALVHAAQASAERLDFAPGDRWLLTVPLAHVAGLAVLVRALVVRATLVLAPCQRDGSFSGLALARVLAAQHVTHASIVPTMLARLLEYCPAAPPALRALLVGGAACPPALLARARQRGLPALTSYGMSEAGASISIQEPERLEDVGRPLRGVELRLVDGEIQLRGPSLLSAYLIDGRLVRASDADGWFHTGDHGVLHAGRLTVLNRRCDLIVTGGENVYPSEVERTLEQHPAIHEACVLGVEDPLWGQLVGAALVLAAELDEEELAAWLAARLASHKRVRRVVFVRALLTTPAGKLDRARMRDELAPLMRPLATSRAPSWLPLPLATERDDHELASRTA